ncbi:hypothetical protein JK358_19050 [Nocardia sp. 2]|uniref:DUF4064 domain-containing protein n=1 Tax=Nocardia acididurans TaxID=2802282 RepID=A0ABS1M784_9NOCA|nr:hypothetical protein [Nocardia acididurans]MBL1076498.1 hypothetical protein [Nocardia acididurans]
MIKNRPALPALLYIVGAIVLGPTIFLAGYLITPANGDFCDASPHGSREQRDRDYALIGNIQSIGGAIMLVIGVLVLLHLWINHRRVGWLAAALLTVGILFMACGYSILLSAGLAGTTTC